MKEDKIQLAIYLTWAALLVSLYLNLGIQPLRMEEPRRALVALEMDLQENWTVPTLFGEPYYNKPPGWNWLIVLSSRIFGEYSEFSVRFFAVLAFFLMGLLSFWVGRRYVSPLFGHASALLFLVNVEIYLFASQLGEIDLFYSLITYAQILALFHFFQRKNFFLLFLVSYSLAALGLLTKGLPSLAFQGVSLLVFLGYKKSLKRLFSFPHIIGLGVFVLIIAGYLLLYENTHPLDGFLNRQFSETQDRTLFAKGISEFVLDLFLFPVETLARLLPASLLLPFLFRKDFGNKLKENPFIEFALFMFLANVLVYWISPGTRARYTYMLYPFGIHVLVYFAMVHGHELPKVGNVLNWIIGIIMGLITLSFWALPYIPELAPLEFIWYPTIGGFLIGVGLVFFYIRKAAFRWLALVLICIIAKIAMSLVVFPIRNLPDEDTRREKDYAIYLSKLVGEEPIYLMKGIEFPHRMGFYLTREKENVLQVRSDTLANAYYIAYPNQVKDIPHEEITDFYDKKETPYVLVKIKPAEP